MATNTSFKIGCDPELFVNKGGKLIAACGLVPGDKNSPHKVENGAVQVDGLALEFNTDPEDLRFPVGYSYGTVEGFTGFNNKVVNVIKQLSDMMPEGHTFNKSTSVEFSEDYYESLHDDHKVLGCDPDFNAYKDGEENPAPNSDEFRLRRGAAGHLHFGWTKDIDITNPEHIAICCDFVKCLDAFVGLGMCFLETDTKRKEVYGKAGAFRPKNYGVEYRTPSNAWIWSKTKRKFIFDLSIAALQNMCNGGIFKTALSTMDVADIINTNDRDRASEALRLVYGGYIPHDYK